VDHSCVKIHAYMGGGDTVQGWQGIEQLEMNILWTIRTSLKAKCHGGVDLGLCGPHDHRVDRHFTYNHFEYT